MHNYRLMIKPEKRPADTIGLLLPVPPSNAHQHINFGELLQAIPGRPLRSHDGGQLALLICGAALDTTSYEYNISVVKQLTPSVTFPPQLQHQFPLSHHLQKIVSDIAARESVQYRRESELATWIAKSLQYRPKGAGNAVGSSNPDVICDLQWGNCLDINTMFSAMLQHMGVQCSYSTGYLIPDARTVLRGWHCWVSTKEGNGVRHWDIGVQLAHGHQTIKDGLEQRGHRYLTMVYGRHLDFSTENLRVHVSHFSGPHWITAAGAASAAAAEITIERHTRV